MRIRRVILGLTRKKKILFLLFAASCVVPFLRKEYNYESKLVRDIAFEHLSGKESKENVNIGDESKVNLAAYEKIQEREGEGEEKGEEGEEGSAESESKPEGSAESNETKEEKKEGS